MKTYHLLLLLLMAAILGFAFFRKGGDNTRVKTKTARKITIEKDILVPGVVQPSKELTIKPIISGIVEAIYVNVGEEVRKGDPLMRIRITGDPVEYEKLSRQFEAVLAQYDHHKRLLETNKTLYEQNVISRAEMEQVETDYKSSEAEYEADKIQLEMLNGKNESNFSSNIVRSTTDGTVLELPIKLGGSVMSRSAYSEGTTVAKLADLRCLTFYGNVTEKDVSLLRSGDTIRLFMAPIPGQEFPAVLRLISPKGNPVDGITVFEVFADLLPDRKTNALIRAGYSANAKIMVGRVQNTLSIEEKYLRFDNDTPYVEVAGPAESVKRQRVVLGLSDGINTQVLSGITINDQLLLPTTQEEPK